MCFQLNNITVALQKNFPFCDKLFHVMSPSLRVQVDILGLMLSGQPFQTSHAHPGTGDPISVWRDADGKFFSKSASDTWESAKVSTAQNIKTYSDTFPDETNSDRNGFIGKLLTLPSPIQVAQEGWDWMRAIGKTFADSPIDTLIRSVAPVALITMVGVAIAISPAAKTVATTIPKLFEKQALLEPQTAAEIGKLLDPVWGAPIIKYLQKRINAAKAGEKLNEIEAITPHIAEFEVNTALVAPLLLAPMFAIKEMARWAYYGIKNIPESVSDAKISLDAHKKASNLVADYMGSPEYEDRLTEAELSYRVGFDITNPEQAKQASLMLLRMQEAGVSPVDANSAIKRLEASKSSHGFGKNTFRRRLKELGRDDLSPEGEQWRKGVINMEIKYGEAIDKLADSYTPVDQVYSSLLAVKTATLDTWGKDEEVFKSYLFWLDREQADNPSKNKEVYEDLISLIKENNKTDRKTKFIRDLAVTESLQWAGTDSQKKEKEAILKERIEFLSGLAPLVKTVHVAVDSDAETSYAYHNTGRMALVMQGGQSPKYVSRAMTHEFGHLVEYSNPESEYISLDYLLERQSGRSVSDIPRIKTIEDVAKFIENDSESRIFTPTTNADKVVPSILGDLPLEYTGYTYWGVNPKGEAVKLHTTELVSTGVESLTDWRTASKKAKEDREHMLYTLYALNPDLS